MLISFSVQNHLSFRDKNTLCMIKSLERQLPTHVCDSITGGFKLLKGGVIYGANAGGKSNFIYSIQAARNCVIENSLVPQSRAFKLSSKGNDPIFFEFRFVVRGNSFAYSFSLQDGAVRTEQLSLIFFQKPEKLLFSRTVIENRSSIRLGPKLQRILGKHLASVIEVLMGSTPNNMLILSDFAKRESIADDVSKLKLLLDPYHWFSDKLDVFRVSSKPSPFELELLIEDDEDFRTKVQKILKAVDPSIDHIRMEKYDGDIKSIVPDDEIIQHLLSVKEDMKGLIQLERRRYVITIIEGKIKIERIVVVRKNESGDAITFELNEESEGIRRIIDLVPLFLRKLKNRVLVIDELERSLHPKVTQMFHQIHYANSNDNQLIFATHEHYLLSQDFYRRDEIWFVEKDSSGTSSLYSMSSYDDIRFDKDIRKEYLRGTFGAIQNVEPMPL